MFLHVQSRAHESLGMRLACNTTTLRAMGMHLARNVVVLYVQYNIAVLSNCDILPNFSERLGRAWVALSNGLSLFVNELVDK